MVNKFLKHLGLAIIRYDKPKNTVVSLEPGNKSKGNVLLSYVIDCFFVPNENMIDKTHQHHWVSWKIAKTFVEFGYSVDAIDYRNFIFQPVKEYAFFVGARTNFQRISKLLNKDCFKIVHLDTAHWIYNNMAAYKRCLDIQKRRGKTLRSYKMVENNWAIEAADMATANLGNQFNIETYAFAKKPIYQIPIPSCSTYNWPEEKDFSKTKKSFLWFGSSGLVHKGLDLVLEAFRDLPDYQLTVCGPLKGKSQLQSNQQLEFEEDFEETFHKELYDTPNIKTIGWVDVESRQFKNILNSCVAIVYPSCSEGGAGSVLICMQAGLIPCVSFESNIEVKDFGITLHRSTIDGIKQGVRSIGNDSPENLSLRARRAWEFTRKYHNRDFFSETFETFVGKLLSDKDEAMLYNHSLVHEYNQSK